MKTFADELRVMGVQFPPDTVIIDATGIAVKFSEYASALGEEKGDPYYHKGDSDVNKYYEIKTPWYEFDYPSIPIFQCMIVEESNRRNPTVNSKDGNIFTAQIVVSGDSPFYGASLKDVTQVVSIELWDPPGVWGTDSRSRVIFDTYTQARFDENGNAVDVVRFDLRKNMLPKLNVIIQSLLNCGFEPETAGLAELTTVDGALTGYAMSLIHKRHEVELVTPTRQYRRRMQRKTGKTPSPFFMLKVGKPGKEYESKGNGHKRGTKNRMHVVRGHFRHVMDHPLPQFNGTFWIPAHMRGSEAQGTVNKGYTIEID